MTTARRSVLYTPADDANMLHKSIKTDADAFIFDLEDSVSQGAKATARENIRKTIPELDMEREIAVRVNGVETAEFAADIETALATDVDAIALPMVTSGDDIRMAWSALEEQSDDPPPLWIAIETPQGIHRGIDIADACQETGVSSLIFGFADYCTALGTPGTPDRIRKRLELLIAEIAAIGNVDPFTSVHLDLEDEEGLRRVAERARETGFVGMAAIHPDQVGVINDVFTPDKEKIERARKLVKAFNESEKNSLLVDGIFLDTATVDRFRRVLKRVPE